MKILVTRTDKLGDLVLSLPVFEYLRGARPDLEIHALVAPGNEPLVENIPQLAGLWTWSVEDTPDTHENLRQRLAKEGFAAVIMLQYRRELALLLRRAGIGRRYGPLSRFSSWFLLNRGSWQKRSLSPRHEMDQNLELARRFLGAAGRRTPRPQHARIHLGPGQQGQGRQFRREYQLENERAVFIHPGSGGSALDWPPERFAGVANALAAQDGFHVFITGTAADAQTIAEMHPLLDGRVRLLVGRYNLRDFLGVLPGADYFVGPSTGPLHMAAALGVATVGLFPPAPTMGPGRWGARGPHTRAITPRVSCPARRFCRGERCHDFNCLEAIYERDVLEAVLQLHRLHAVPEEES
ncbi:hypothetical protein CSA17_03980 [bacterium DOLJORAL78_65_58]|nr:MAG: hypothetical protein CSB20_13690 [bacterium DOLZORAL124_64_63]PIE76101.1 MAG: hypothetical protein CSA17_03980 [bacterium DOLJORAL78_65_58]